MRHMKLPSHCTLLWAITPWQQRSTVLELMRMSYYITGAQAEKLSGPLLHCPPPEQSKLTPPTEKSGVRPLGSLTWALVVLYHLLTDCEWQCWNRPLQQSQFRVPVCLLSRSHFSLSESLPVAQTLEKTDSWADRVVSPQAASPTQEQQEGERRILSKL